MNFEFLEITRRPTDALLKLLNSNVIGTPGLGMRYQHLGVNDKIYKIADPFFVNLVRKNSTIVGTCCFCDRETINHEDRIRSFYIRYFSFNESFRSKNLKRIAHKTGLLRSEIKMLLEGHSLNISSTKKFFHYAYVDPRNVRSVLLCNEFGFETVRQFSTIVFNRINPRRITGITEIGTSDEEHMRNLLRDQYKDHNMYCEENLFNGRKYFAIKDPSGQILAGAQVNPDRWNIRSLPNVSGNILLNILTHIPYLNRLFNKDYRFLAVDGIYYRKGHGEVLTTLLEGLLVKYGVYSAMVLADTNGALYQTLKKLDLGLVDKLNTEIRIDVICRFINFSETEKQLFRQNPAYISAIDAT